MTGVHGRWVPEAAMYHARTRKDESTKGVQQRPYDGAFIKWWTYDEDVLEIIRMFVEYFAADSERGRPPATLSVVRKAISVLGISTRPGGDYQGRRRKAYLGRKWRERLETAGIDPETLKVNNRKRWALTWEQLKRNGYYEPSKVENAYRMKWFVPAEEELTPQTVAISPETRKLRETREVEAQKQVEVNNYLSGVFNKHVSL